MKRSGENDKVIFINIKTLNNRKESQKLICTVFPLATEERQIPQIFG